MLGWETFLWPQLIGFFLLALGTLIYNEVIVLPFWGFKEAVANHQADRDERNKDYLGMSPEAMYNSKHYAADGDDIKEMSVN